MQNTGKFKTQKVIYKFILKHISFYTGCLNEYKSMKFNKIKHIKTEVYFYFIQLCMSTYTSNKIIF